MWNYQEILSELQPSPVIEFGTTGSAHNIMRQIGQPFKVLPWTTHKALDPRARREPGFGAR